MSAWRRAGGMWWVAVLPGAVFAAVGAAMLPLYASGVRAPERLVVDTPARSAEEER